MYFPNCEIFPDGESHLVGVSIWEPTFGHSRRTRARQRSVVLGGIYFGRGICPSARRKPPHLPTGPGASEIAAILRYWQANILSHRGYKNLAPPSGTVIRAKRPRSKFSTESIDDCRSNQPWSNTWSRSPEKKYYRRPICSASY